MNVKQISVFLENKKGRLAEVTNIIAKAKINIKALSLAETTDFGIVRIIVDSPDKCLMVLKNKGFVVQETDVIAIEVRDKPGGLNDVLKLLNKYDINIEYIYATIERRSDKAVVIFKIPENMKVKFQAISKKL